MNEILDTTQESKSIVPEDQWPELALDELITQKNILYDRWEFLHSKGNVGAKVFVQGIEKLDQLIQAKLNINEVSYF